MAAAILDQGQTVIRDGVNTVVTHVGVATDATAFVATQTVLDPAGGGAANRLIKAATKAIVDFQTRDYTMTIDGTLEMTGKTIFTIGILNGSATGNAVTRSVRSAGIGVQAGDSFTIGVRVKHEDNS
jgi:hypothetical protein